MSDAKDTLLWWPMFALPNIQTKFPIEVDAFAFVPHDDFRLKAITKVQPRFGSFMKKFKNEFGNTVHPSVIIWQKGKPDTYRTISAISGFRDLTEEHRQSRQGVRQCHSAVKSQRPLRMQRRTTSLRLS